MTKHLLPWAKEGPELHYKHLNTVGALVSNHKQVQLKIISQKSCNKKFLLNYLRDIYQGLLSSSMKKMGFESKSKYSAFFTKKSYLTSIKNNTYCVRSCPA